jgi:hypothetical protein
MSVDAAIAENASYSQGSMWRQQRSELTHDWLRNRLLPRLHACIAIARDEIRATEDMIGSLVAALREWPLRSVDVLRLMDDFCQEMSPLRAVRQLFARLPAELTAYVRMTAFDCWMAKHQIAARLTRIREIQLVSDALYGDWSARCALRPTQRDLALSLRELVHLAQACEQMAVALSELPSHAVL